jgi:hypothetical protein
MSRIVGSTLEEADCRHCDIEIIRVDTVRDWFHNTEDRERSCRARSVQ